MSRQVRVVVFSLALALWSASSARAQFLPCIVCPPANCHPPIVRGPGLSFSRPDFFGAGFAGGFYSRSVFIGPVLPPVSTLTPFGWSGGFLPAGWGVGPGAGVPWSPPVIVVQPPFVLAGGQVERREDPQDALAFEELPKPINPLPAGARPGQFIVITPKKAFPGLGQMNMEVDRVAAAPRPPVFHFDPFARRIKVEAEARNLDPAEEAVRLVALGRSAFVAGDYGKAAEQFERASASNVKLASAHFLKGQAAFAAGRYSLAVDAIRAGLAIDPAWPASSFDPKEPYGPSVTEFAVHLAELRKSAAANPGEPTLEFLLGYQLWFIGERAEARKWLELAAGRLGESGPVSLFK